MPTFRRVGQTTLYTEAIESGHSPSTDYGPLAYYIPPFASTLLPLITMDRAWNWFKYSGLRPRYFLLLEHGPTIPTALVGLLDQAVLPMRVRTATGFDWVQGDHMDDEILSFQFLETGFSITHQRSAPTEAPENTPTGALPAQPSTRSHPVHLDS